MRTLFAVTSATPAVVVRLRKDPWIQTFMPVAGSTSSQPARSEYTAINVPAGASSTLSPLTSNTLRNFAPPSLART